MSLVIAVASLLMSVVSFALFATISIRQLQTPPKDPAEPDPKFKDNVADTAEALAKLVDSVSGAKPAVLCLLASIFFTLIAQQAAAAADEAAAAAVAATQQRCVCEPARQSP